MIVQTGLHYLDDLVESVEHDACRRSWQGLIAGLAIFKAMSSLRTLEISGAGQAYQLGAALLDEAIGRESRISSAPSSSSV
jgi:hypothetical protein